MLAGHPPFVRDTPQRVLAAHLTETPKPIDAERPDVPQHIAAILTKCLAKDPQDRPASADEILNALNSVSSSATSAARASGDARAHWRPRWIVAGVALLLLIVAGVYLKRTYRGSEPASAEKSIAVLPLANLSGDKSNDFLGEGLAEEITGALAKAGVHVVGRSSAFTLSGKGMGAAEIARQLHAANVLQGSVQRSGDRVRISVSLVSMPDESVMWSERYDRGMQDVFAMQDEIAKAVAGELKVKLNSKS